MEPVSEKDFLFFLRCAQIKFPNEFKSFNTLFFKLDKSIKLNKHETTQLMMNKIISLIELDTKSNMYDMYKNIKEVIIIYSKYI